MRTKQNTIIYNPAMENGQRWVEYPEHGLRLVGKAHDIARKHDRPRSIGHTGWFTNEYQDEKVCGLVYRLPAKNGESRYLAAVEDENGNDGALIDFSEVFTDEMEAALRSDRIAELYADEQREYSRVEDAKMRYEDLTADIETAWVDCRTMCRGIRALNPGEELKKLIRKHVCSVRREVRELRKERKEHEWAVTA